MSIKIQSLIFILFCSSADAMDYYKISNNGLYSYNGELLNQEISNKPSTYSYSITNQSAEAFTLHRDVFLNSSSEQCSMRFKQNQRGEYQSSYLICYDELISVKEHKKLPAVKIISLNNLTISNYTESVIASGEYNFESKSLADGKLFHNIGKISSSSPNNISCNYYNTDYHLGVTTKNIRCYESAVIQEKAYLHEKPRIDDKTKKYLIPGDIVIPLDEKVDDSGHKWVYVFYQGKKNIQMWVNGGALKIRNILQ